MQVMHQPLPIVKALPLTELFVYAKAAAAMSGREFN
jgi:hypothetical protein